MKRINGITLDCAGHFSIYTTQTLFISKLPLKQRVCLDDCSGTVHKYWIQHKKIYNCLPQIYQYKYIRYAVITEIVSIYYYKFIWNLSEIYYWFHNWLPTLGQFRRRASGCCESWQGISHEARYHQFEIKWIYLACVHVLTGGSRVRWDDGLNIIT